MFLINNNKKNARLINGKQRFEQEKKCVATLEINEPFVAFLEKAISFKAINQSVFSQCNNFTDRDQKCCKPKPKL